MTYKNGMETRRFNPDALKGSKERDYWLQKLSNLPGKTTFPYEPGKTGKTRDMHTLSAELTDPIYSTMVKISNNSDVRLHIILVAGWLMLLNKYTGSSDIIVGIPIYKQKTGDRLINTVLALRNRVNGEMTVKELLLQVGETVLEANQNQNYPINTLLYKLKVPGSGGDFPLFDISILLEEIHHRSYLEGIRQDMIVSFSKTPSALQCVVEYNRQVYSRTTMNRIIVHFRQLLHNALADVDTPIGQLDILTEQERKQLLKDFNDNAADFPRDKTVPQLIAEQAEKNPGNTALIGPKLHSPDEKHTSITYGELHKKTDALAYRLKEKGITLETVAAVMMERSIEMVECILAIWKAGGAYLPIDPSCPQERIDYILENSDARIVMSTPADIIEKGASSTLILTSTLSEVGPANLAYIIYTSGSTGKPKGAMVEHIGMMNHIYSKIDTLNITENSIIAQDASHTFDISVWQFFTALTRGGKTVIYPDSLIMDPQKLITRISDDRVTILEVVPSYLSVLLAAIPARQDIPFSLEYLLVTGEEIKPQLVNRWFARFPAVKMVNAYGPTEASDDITHHVMDRPPDADSQRVPIGKPIRNLNIYIVDEHMKLCPIGIKGEICVSGVGVGRGYIKNEEKTRRVFMEDPFVEEKGVRLYKTGDIGCWLPDGTIDYFGRKDHQVKIRGFRIELGEIENRLLSHPQVKEAVVLDREDAKDNKFLCAYIVDTGVTGTQLKEYLSRTLPDHMVPAHFLKLERIPLTPNGKIDRNALLEMKVGASPGENSRIDYISEEMLNRLAAALEVEKSAGESFSLEEIDSRRQEETATEAERQQILYRFNDTEAEFPHDKTVYQLLEDQVEQKPDKIAAAGESLDAALAPDVRKNEIYDLPLSYKELNRRANQLARRLQARGIKRNSIVGIMMEPSPELLIAVLAIMKAGGAYLAMEVSYPDKRIDYLCKDSSMELIVMGKNRELPDKASMVVKAIDEKLYRGEADNLPLANTSRDPAALFYTSGSTGKPKGVIDEHQGLVNRIWWLQRFYPLDENDVILQITPIIFDVSAGELFGWFPAGASLYFISPWKGNKPENVVDAIVKGSVTQVHIPPAFQLPFLHYLENSGRMQEMRRLKRVYASGEALLPTHVNEFNRLLYRSRGTRLINLYGPTEASIEVSYYDCSSDQPLEKVPIGKPIHNLRLYIVNKNLELVPVGVPGELCIAGVGLARGYLNQPKLTAEKFCLRRPGGRFLKKLPPWTPRKNFSLFPHHSTTPPLTTHHSPLYLTGDLARWLPDGNIEFLGRFDHQVQLGGIRIELGEIESELLKHRDIKEAAVVSWKDENDKHSLCAFVKSDNHRDLSRSDFKTVLAGELPHFMMPARFVELDEIPLTTSGKIDRKILQKMVPHCQTEGKNITAEIIKRMQMPGKTFKQQQDDIDGPKETPAVLTEEERQRILYRFNDTDASYPTGKTLHRLFEEQVEKTPGSTAVVCMHRTVSYRQLNEKSNRLAHLLIQKGVGSGYIVGVMIEPSLEMITALLAVMKAGGIYLPIGPEFPASRITYMLQDCGTGILFTDKKTAWTSLEVIDINDPGQENAAVSNPPEVNKSTDPTHILYTSGTTGTPKGVIIEHKNVVRLLFNDKNLFDFNSSDVWTMFHEYFFDFSVWEMYGALLYGGKLIVVPKIVSGDPAQFLQLVKKEQVTVLNQTPSNFYHFAAEELKQPHSQLRLRYVIFGGESLKPIKLKEWKEKYPHTKLINMYGITETTVHVTFKEIGNEEITSNQNNIGGPIPTLRIHILNSNMELLPVGTAGELFVSGEGVSRGYLNQPELTADKFLTAKTHEGTRRINMSYMSNVSYRTGDLARWQPNGDIEFLGRKDMQIQLRGLRIEPGEIESILLKYEGVEEAVIVVKNDENGEEYLRALLVSSQDLGKDRLRKYLAGRLPQYMIPAEFLRLEKLPLTANRKVNRKLLELLTVEEKKPEVEYTAPKTEIELKIAAIWKEVLNTPKVGIHDNFFDIGGNSLGIIQVNFKLKEILKRDIPALIMFEYPTIASIVRYLEKNLEDSTTPARDDEQKDRREKTGRGQNKMRQRRGKLKQIRIE